MGSNFIRHLYRTYPDYQIYNLDLLTYAGNPDNLADIEELEYGAPAGRKRYHFIYGDICDDRLLKILFARHRFDMVVNFAAETHVDRSIIDMNDFIRTNVGGARSLIEAVRRYGVGRFVHISTDEIYGDVPHGIATEDSPLRPSNPYSSSKAAADLIIQSFIRTHKVPAIIVRGSNNYGPYQYPEKLIPLAISNLIEGKKVPVHGTGEHIRTWIHVEDFCRAVDTVMHNAPVYSMYNVSGEQQTNIGVLRHIAKHVGVDLDRHKEHITDRPGADTRYAPDSTKLRTELGWQPLHTLENSLGGVVAWYLKNRPWWEHIKQRKEFVDHYEKQAKGQWY